MTNTKKVDDFMSKLNHPLKKEIEAVIDIIRGVSSKLEEDVKWGGPSFEYKEPMVTLNPRVKEYVALVFHQGQMLNDGAGLLENGPKGRAYAKFHTMADLKKHRTQLETVVKQWIKLMDKSK